MISLLGSSACSAGKDLPISFLNLTGPLVLLLAALLAAAQQKRAEAFPTRRRWRAALLALVYAAGAMAAMYITYTPVGMVRIVGLQARYFLCVWLALLPALAVLLRKTIRPAITEERPKRPSPRCAPAMPFLALCCSSSTTLWGRCTSYTRELAYAYMRVVKATPHLARRREFVVLP